MALHVIKMPDIGEGIAEVEVVEWRVQPGDSVVEDQILADVMTDKATIEIPSPVAGTVLALGGKAGELMAVGAELIRIEMDGAGHFGTSEKPAPAAATVATVAPAAPAPEPARVASAPASKPEPVIAPVVTDKVIASPALRRRAWELGVDLQEVTASGTGGRIMQHDLDAYVAAHGSVKPQQQTATGYTAQHAEEKVPVIGLRRKIAQKMQDAKRHIPHFTYVEEIDMTELETLRSTLNAKWGNERGHLTVLPFLMRAIVLAVREFPQMNARFDDEVGVVTRYAAVHIGIAAQTPSGLMVPVVKHAESLDLWNSAAEVARQAEAARSGKISRQDLSGSTITITSLGRLGGIASTPIINHPEVAIIGINRMVLRPMIRNGAVVPRQMMNLSSSFDHRVVDGMHAAEFIQVMRGYLECPAMLFAQ